MKTFTKIVTAILLMAAVTLTACKKGDTGPVGPQGEQGIKGDDGNTILSGNGAPAASIGKTGDFYIDLNADALYGPKTASGWGTPDNLKGAAGAKGDKGDKGDKGSTGATGPAGKNGNTILSGSGAPASSLGVAGDYYFDKTNSLFYGPKTSSGWGGGLQLKGKDGNANVKTRIFATNSLTWEPNGSGVVTTIKVPEITKDLLNYGAVFVSYGNKDQVWLPMPVISTDSHGIVTLNMMDYPVYTDAEKGVVQIAVWNIDNNYTSIETNGSIKVVCIAGVDASANINLKDYNAVKKAFHLDD